MLAQQHYGEAVANRDFNFILKSNYRIIINISSPLRWNTPLSSNIWKQKKEASKKALLQGLAVGILLTYIFYCKTLIEDRLSAKENSIRFNPSIFLLPAPFHKRVSSAIPLKYMNIQIFPNT